MTLSDFAKSYLRSQGVQVLASTPRERTRIVGERKGEVVPVVPMHERGD